MRKYCQKLRPVRPNLTWRRHWQSVVVVCYNRFNQLIAIIVSMIYTGTVHTALANDLVDTNRIATELGGRRYFL